MTINKPIGYWNNFHWFLITIATLAIIVFSTNYYLENNEVGECYTQIAKEYCNSLEARPLIDGIGYRLGSFQCIYEYSRGGSERETYQTLKTSKSFNFLTNEIKSCQKQEKK